MTKNKKIGLGLIIGPFTGLILILMAWSITSFVIGQLLTASPVDTYSAGSGAATALGSGDVRQTAASIINVALGFLGILCVLGVIIGFPLGIVFLAKKDENPNTKYDERSGKGDRSVVPDEIKGWNWGAAGLTIIWGLYHNVWICLIGFIPIVNLFWWIFMGVYGSEWAWKKQKWESVQQFKDAQRKWMPFGIAIFILWGLYIVWTIISAAASSSY